MEKIIISPFCKKRDQKYCNLPLEDIIKDVQDNFHNAKEGYRKGVILIPIDPKNFIGSIITLQAGDRLSGEFRPRQEGEEPRKEVRYSKNSTANGCCLAKPDEIVAVDVVLYSNATLAEGKENSDSTADWEVITFLTKINGEEQPMPPDTLMSDHFYASGGTNTHMSPEEFQEALRKSFNFWKDKTILY